MAGTLSLSNVSRIFGETRAVDGVSLDIAPGQFVHHPDELARD